ncbi:MAG: shikimate kinase [Deltaproteobacteria bacterium]|nr:shikimate kinase [Deltaproteobacteria bacterium]
MNNLYLVGYRGTGKTTLGKLVADKLGRTFVDSDDLIVARANCSISEIFAKFGEDYFRALEKEVIEEFSRRDNLVVACGGGVVIQECNIAALKRSGVVCLLVSHPDDIFQRITGDTSRPALTNDPLQEEILSMLSRRAEFYEQSKHFEVNTSNNDQNRAAVLIAEGYSKFMSAEQ